MSSTRGYFLKQANQDMTAINFQYEILKTRLIDYKQQNRNTVQSSSFKRDVVDVSAEIVKIPDGVHLGFLSSQDLIN
jgi:succinylarginine dihydrolase